MAIDFKKRIEEQYQRELANMSFEERINLQYKKQKAAETAWKKEEEDDIAPVKKERSWFNTGAFDDGYQIGDVTKSILGTIGDVGSNVMEGVASVGHNLAALSAGGVAEVADFIGKDEYADKVRNRLAGKDEETNEFLNKYSPKERFSDASDFFGGNSLLGEKSDNLASSAGSLFGAMALQTVGVPGMATMGLQAAGGELENAYKSGATSKEAWTSAAVTGISEAVIERLSGGVSFGTKTLDELWKEPLTRAITNRTANTFAKYGLDLLGEGAEEVITEAVQSLGRLSYEDKSVREALFSEEARDNYIEAFIGGGIIGGGFNAKRAYDSVKTGRDYDTGLSANEQKVIDSEVKNRTAEKQKKAAVEAKVSQIINERERTLGTLTDAEKKNIQQSVQAQLDDGTLDYSKAEIDKKELAAIEKQVREDLDLGYIGIDTIENTLAGEKTAQINELKAELDKTTNEAKKAEIQAKINELTADRATQMQELLRKDVYLQESYRQEALRSQEFTREASNKDSDITKELMESAKAVGMNNTRKMHNLFEYTNKIANDSGTKYGFVNNKQLKELGHEVEGVNINGLVRVDKDGKTKVLINVDSDKALNAIIGHETTHLMEGTSEYKPLQDIVKQYATTKGDYDARLQSMKKLYEGVDANLENEITADLVGDYLFTDEQFIKELTTNRNVFQKIYDYIKHAYKMATAGSQEKRQLERVKRSFDKAYKEMSKATTQQTKDNLATDADSSTKYSLSDSDGRKLTQAQQEYFKNSKVRDENGSLLRMYHGTSSAGFTVFEPYGRAKFGLFGAGSYFTADPEVALSYTEKGRGNNPDVYEVYLNITNPIDMDAPGDSTAWKKALPDADFPETGTNEAFFRAMEEYFEDEGYARWEAEETAMDVIESMGYDGITHIGGGRFNKADETRHRVYIAFQSEQIKSFNNANPTDHPDIRYSLSGDSSVSKYSLNSWNDTDKSQVLTNLTNAGYKKTDAEKWINDVNSVAAVIARSENLDYDPDEGQTMLKNNQEYVKTLDASTLCKKRLLYQGTYNAIQHRLPNTALMPEDVLRIREMMAEKGLEVPCGICYEESRKKNEGKFAKKWLSEYNGDYKPTLEEVTTTDGRERLKAEHPEVLEDYLKFQKTRGSANPKVTLTRTDYQGEILGLSQSDIEKIKHIGGLRVQSFSDFETPHLIDMMQAVLDMAEMKLTSQAYTKVPNFARVFGDTGIKINLSLIGQVDKNGKLVFDGKEGINPEEAFEIRNRHSKHVGTILVGANKESILAGWADDRIDMVIPFHRSGWKLSELETLGLTGYRDFTRYQSERYMDGSKNGLALSKVKKNHGFEMDELYSIDYWDYSKTGKENAEEYLRLCAEQKRRPVFYNFLVDNGDGSYSLQPDGSTDGYWKSLVDFKMYDNDGVGSPQELVRPNFNMNEAHRVLEEYDENPNELPVADEIVEQFVSEYNGNHLRGKYSLSGDAAPMGSYNVYRSDVLMPEAQTVPETPVEAPVEEIAPVVIPEELRYEEGRPLTEEDLPNFEKERSWSFSNITENDAPEEIAPVAPEYEPEIEPVNPLEAEGRDIKEVGKRNVKAYMYENPEVRPFFQREAQYMLNDLQNSVKGEKHFNGDLYYISGGEEGFWGTKRQTSDEIAYLPDEFKYTYADIEKGLKAIIEDHGAENNAVSKRIEFMLDERLREGYTDAMYGDTMPPDEDYLNLLREKQITEYSDEAYEAWLKSIDFNEFAPMDGVQKQYNPDTGAIEGDAQAEAKAALARARTENRLFGYESRLDSHDFTVSRGVQQEYDMEAGEIVDDTHDIELERLEKRKKKALDDLGDLTSYTKQQAQTLYDEVRMMQKGKKVSGDLGFILDRMFEGVDKNADNYNEVKDATYKKITDALLAIERSPVKPERQVPPTEALIRNSIETKYGWRVSEIEGMKLDSRAEAKRKLRKELIGLNSEGLTKALDDAKNIPMVLMNNTDTIRNTEFVFGRENGKLINEAIFQKEIDNEAKSIAWQNKERSELKELGIKARSKESAAVQKYGEKQYVNEFGDLVKYGDDELAAEFSDVETQAKIRKAARIIRDKYDNYIDLANETLTKLGFDPIKKRSDYMRHFQELNDVFSRYGLPFNAQAMQEHALPTDINGLTEDWSPQKNYFANMQPRKGQRTTLDAITGIDGYIGGIANLIYHTEDIQRGRAFEEIIRETYGQEKGWENLDALEGLSPEEYQARADKIQDNHLSNYAAWVHEWTNNIAGKKSKVDRSVEAMFGRRIFSLLDQTRKQVGSNMIGFNLSSSLTNLVAPVQAMAKTNKLAVVKGTADTIKNIFVKDDFMDRNSFLTARMGTDMLSKTPWQKMQDAGYVFMKGMDWFSSNQIVRSKYYELLSKGMTEEQAHAEAGKFAARIMGDRTKGAQAALYNSKVIGLVTQFQLEVNNQLYSMFYDTYQESKANAKGNAARMAAGMTFTLGQLAAFSHVFGKTFEAVAGYNPTFDIIGIIATAFGAGDDDEEKTASERMKAAADKLVDALPYVNILTGGGRIPIASGIPNVIGVMTGGKDEYGNELTWGGEAEKLRYLIPPTGGNQVKKTMQGLGMFDEDLPISGSYTDSGNLRFPVEDTPLNRVQAGLFGQWASGNARDYFDNERQPLKEKQIQEYADLDIPIADYWEYREGLKDKETIEAKFDYVAGLDLPVSKKNIMINNLVEREEEVDLTNYSDFGSYEEFDFAANNRQKYDWLQANNVPYSEYNRNEVSREAYNWAYKNQEGYAVSKAVSDVVTYRQISGSLYDIKADKDSEGKSISGSRKEKVASYINGLDLDYGAKLILFKGEYPSYDDANMDIIDYLNGREDITYNDMVTILTELGFTVDAEGNIHW